MEAVIEMEKVEQALDTIRPALARDGGNILLIGIEGGIIRVKLVGACQGCPSSGYTLRLGVERRLKELIPAIQSIVHV